MIFYIMCVRTFIIYMPTNSKYFPLHTMSKQLNKNTPKYTPYPTCSFSCFLSSTLLQFW